VGKALERRFGAKSLGLKDSAVRVHDPGRK
jgi:hypothetical protein